jgi:phosphoribosylformylglycinamidine synthase
VSAGGLGVALAETAMLGGRGLTVDVSAEGRADEVLLGEGQAWVVVSADPERLRGLEERVAAAGLDVVGRGTVGGEDVVVRLDETELRMPLSDAVDAYERAIPHALEVPQ